MVHRIRVEDEVVKCLYCGRVFASMRELLAVQECQPLRLEPIESKGMRNGKTSIACSGGFHARCFWNECGQCECECHSAYLEEDEEETP